MLRHPNLAKAVGSDPLAHRIAALQPDCHVFGCVSSWPFQSMVGLAWLPPQVQLALAWRRSLAFIPMHLKQLGTLPLLRCRHTHFGWDARLPDSPSPHTRFVQCPLAYPPERTCARTVVTCSAHNLRARQLTNAAPPACLQTGLVQAMPGDCTKAASLVAVLQQARHGELEAEADLGLGLRRRHAAGGQLLEQCVRAAAPGPGQPAARALVLPGLEVGAAHQRRASGSVGIRRRISRFAARALVLSRLEVGHQMGPPEHAAHMRSRCRQCLAECGNFRRHASGSAGV